MQRTSDTGTLTEQLHRQIRFSGRTDAALIQIPVQIPEQRVGRYGPL
ncbi:MAG: hypothetical protein HN810_08520 [Acidiferrobacteraceae bacterium]|nr:hypothetical protein [Acidiferrobacteraceae bacterium]MBT3973028.1 hypothetical protein [Acidiferrobacteraceae bacterium]MBT4404237.1 hypothetical protein [Acidiferrobacteraceae bacterium]MBT5980795.1 hypothetical protein [Acidiferrobacteraceae bacterium]MBT6733184.1 hypothetical protein [Acidiferrobacteraceae bacterium]